jgi:hypothetical protein
MVSTICVQEAIMAAKKNAESRTASTALVAPPLSWGDALQRHLAKIPEIDAVFVWAERSVVHVYSLVHEFQSRIYEKLLRKERLIEKAFPGISFEFHVRAHQGREPHLAVPHESKCVFLRC